MPNNNELLMQEYRENNFNFRALATFRVTVLTLFAGFTAWLFRFMWDISLKPEEASPLLRIIVPLIGAGGALLGEYTERRLLQFYKIILKRLLSLESELNSRGVFTELDETPAKPHLRTVSRRIFYFGRLVFIGFALFEILRYLY